MTTLRPLSSLVMTRSLRLQSIFKSLKSSRLKKGKKTRNVSKNLNVADQEGDFLPLPKQFS